MQIHSRIVADPLAFLTHSHNDPLEFHNKLQVSAFNISKIFYIVCHAGLLYKLALLENYLQIMFSGFQLFVLNQYQRGVSQRSVPALTLLFLNLLS